MEGKLDTSHMADLIDKMQIYKSVTTERIQVVSIITIAIKCEAKNKEPINILGIANKCG